MKPLNLNIPTKVFFGDGKIEILKQLLSEKEKNVLIITDHNLISHTNIIQKVEAILSEKRIFIYKEIEENPSVTTVEYGVKAFKNHSIDLVIGIGGGSCMDTAKGISLRLANPGNITEYINKKEVVNDPLPLICIPTTSGTGSEVTPFAVFTDRQKGSKNALVHDKIYPKYSIIDPELSHSMPTSLILDTGLDALGHSIEAYLSTIASEETQNISVEAIQTVANNLENALLKDPASMGKMAYASMLGGLAISQASTILPHIMGYPLTVYYNIPHGRAGMILLPAFMRLLKRDQLIKSKSGGIDQLLDEKTGLEGFLERLGVSAKLSDYGVKKTDIGSFIEKVIKKDDIKITPIKIIEEIIYDIYISSL